MIRKDKKERHIRIFIEKQNLAWQIIIYYKILKILFQKLCYAFILFMFVFCFVG